MAWSRNALRYQNKITLTNSTLITKTRKPLHMTACYKSDKIMVIKKVQLDIMFRDWWETDLTKIIDIEKEQVINVVIEEGSVYLIYLE